ncbi:GH16349 [Drosophila grimshawi]|uniref:GH16349 n=2 Tax=Drosophila grimshawi TaxID=7222 RepID=B4IYS2_DROGR|nr:GH16349 [Drosophila grimshawi]
MSQHAGGLQSPPTDRRQTTHNSNQNASHFYQSRKATPQSENGDFFFFEDRGQSSGEKRPHFYQNKTPQQDQRRNYGYRGGRGRGSHRSTFGDRSGNNPSSQYFHSSMLEDPWHELMERHNAIHGSVLSDDPRADIDAS